MDALLVQLPHCSHVINYIRSLKMLQKSPTAQTRSTDPVQVKPRRQVTTTTIYLSATPIIMQSLSLKTGEL